MKNVRADARCTSSWRWCRSAAGRRGGRRRRRRSCSRCLEPSNHRYSQCCSRRVCTALTLKLRRVAQLCGVARLASSRRGAARWRRLARLQARARSPPSSGRWGGCTPVLQKARGRCAPSLPLTQPTASPLASLPPLLWRLFSLPRLPSARTSQPSPLTTLLSPLSLTIHLSLAAVCRRRHHRCNRHRAVTTSPAAVFATATRAATRRPLRVCRLRHHRLITIIRATAAALSVAAAAAGLASTASPPTATTHVAASSPAA